MQSKSWMLQTVRSALHAPHSSVVLLVPAALNDFHERRGPHIEAQLTVLLAIELFKYCADVITTIHFMLTRVIIARASGLPMTVAGHAQFWKEKLFIVTPQHIQRLTGILLHFFQKYGYVCFVFVLLFFYTPVC